MLLPLTQFYDIAAQFIVWALLVKGGRPLACSMTWALWPKLTLFPSPLLTPQQSSLSSEGSDWPAATALQYSSYLCEVGSRVLPLLHVTMTVLLSYVLWCLASKALSVIVGTHCGQTWCSYRLRTWPCLAIL